jgi:hypothetical protein
VDLVATAAEMQSTTPLYRKRKGVELLVDQRAIVILPLAGSQELELEYEAAGPYLLTFGNFDGVDPIDPTSRPWRYRRLAPGRGTLKVDLREASGFTTKTRPYLAIHGNGRFELARLRVRPLPTTREEVLAGFDRAQLWAPNAMDYTVVNALETPMWSAVRGTPLYLVLGVAFLALVAAVAAGWRLLRKAWHVQAALAAGALLAAGAGDVVSMAKLLPALELAPKPDPERRIRENYAFNPEAGALAALARASLRPGDRVGIVCLDYLWHARELLCFNLAPRRCVYMDPGQAEHAGLSGVDRLLPGEIDAVVSYQSDEPPPPGFTRTAQLGPRAWVARRP